MEAMYADVEPLSRALDPLTPFVDPKSAYYRPLMNARAASYLEEGDAAWRYSRLDGLWSSVGCCVAFLLLRWLWRSANRVWRARASKSELIMLQKVEEEAYTTVGGAVLLVCGWRALQMMDECSVLNNAGCTRNWPLIPNDMYIVRYYNVELGWYLHLMLKHSLGLGLQDTRSMDLHHVSTVCLIVMSYLFQFHQLGLLIFTLLNMSSPVLHASKLANTLDMRRTKVVLFAAFAAIFAVTRVVVFPYVVVRCTIMGAYNDIPELTEHNLFFVVWSLIIALLTVLAVMQAYWFAAIVRILRHVTAGNEKGLKEEVLKRDFSREVRNVATRTGVAA